MKKLLYILCAGLYVSFPLSYEFRLRLKSKKIIELKYFLYVKGK
jgi:hypothetical protein